MSHDRMTGPYPSGSEAIANLCGLLRDLETMGFELLAAEEATGQPIDAYRGLLADRLAHVGVSDEKIAAFTAWKRDFSDFIRLDACSVDNLPRIAALERQGAACLGDCIAFLRAKNSEPRQRKMPFAA
jgi:hypothetical protein